MLNSILLGAQKAGSSSLFNWLAQHPEIYAPEVTKDTHFFTDESLAPKGVDYMHSYFQEHSGEPVVLTGAVNYIYLPEAAPKLFEYNPGMKLLLILRDPIKRAFSSFAYNKKLGIEAISTFSEALEKEKKAQYSTVYDRGNYTYIDHGFYHRQIQRYLEFFPVSQLKVVFFEEFIKDKLAVMRELFAFLEVDPDFEPVFQHVNRTGEVRFPLLNRLYYQESGLKQFARKYLKLHKLVPMERRIALGDKLREWNTQEGEGISLDPEEYRSLQSVFREDIDKLSHLLERDLSKIWF